MNQSWELLLFVLQNYLGGLLMLFYMEGGAFVFWEDWHRNTFSPLVLLGSCAGHRQVYLA